MIPKNNHADEKKQALVKQKKLLSFDGDQLDKR
jgi:hypothetical protein